MENFTQSDLILLLNLVSGDAETWEDDAKRAIDSSWKSACLEYVKNRRALASKIEGMIK